MKFLTYIPKAPVNDRKIQMSTIWKDWSYRAGSRRKGKRISILEYFISKHMLGK